MGLSNSSLLQSICTFIEKFVYLYYKFFELSNDYSLNIGRTKLENIATIYSNINRTVNIPTISNIVNPNFIIKRYNRKHYLFILYTIYLAKITSANNNFIIFLKIKRKANELIT